MKKKTEPRNNCNYSQLEVDFSTMRCKQHLVLRGVITFLYIGLLMMLSNYPAFGFSITPAQPGAATNYRFTDVYTLPGGAQRSVALNPAGIEEILRGGTDTFLATLQAEFPTWTFNIAPSNLTGTFNIQNYYACGLGTNDCGTEQGVPGTIVGNFIDITYTPGAGDPTSAANDLHWIQRFYSNHALGTGGGHGVNDDKIDNDNTTVDPILGACSGSPYYDCGYFAGETFFVDRPSRSGDPGSDHVWGAELYLVEQTAANTVTIYNGLKWGWLNTASDIRALTAPPSAIIFDNPIPSVGGPTVATGIGTNSITWGTAVDGSFASSLSITPSTLDLTPLIGEPFVLGTITYANGTIVSGSGLSSIEMSVQTTIDVADLGITGLTVDDTRITTMINTPNTCNADVPGDCTDAEARESADYVTIPPAADLTAVPATFPNFSELGNNFHVLEESSASATLIGRITEAKITAAGGGGGGGLLPPGPDAPPPGTLAPRTFVVEILGFGKVLEGDGFITRGLPGPSVGDIVTLGDVGGILTGGGTVTTGFGFGSQDLTRTSVATLEKVVRLMLDMPGIKIEAGGHTDDIGSAEFNRGLSLKRAKKVQQFLAIHGIREDRVVVRGYGEDAPIASNKTKDGRAKNLRVELKIINKPKKKN